jgi:predicted DNA-binding protein (MmcQ/YjbR family)
VAGASSAGHNARVGTKLHGETLLARLRALCLALPETSETDSFGHPNFRAGKRTFAVYEHYRGRASVAVKLPRADGAALLADPRFYVTPYSGKHGWVSLWVDEPVSWELVEELVRTSYREVALKRMLAALDGRAGASTRDRTRASAEPRAGAKRRGSSAGRASARARRAR